MIHYFGRARSLALVSVIFAACPAFAQPILLLVARIRNDSAPQIHGARVVGATPGRYAGATVVPIRISNARGAAARNLTILGGRYSLGQTPPMGWNLWNAYGRSVTGAFAPPPMTW